MNFHATDRPNIDTAMGNHFGSLQGFEISFMYLLSFLKVTLIRNLIDYYYFHVKLVRY